MTRVQISSLATRSPFVSEVEVLKHAPGTTSRVFPACNACQNALTLTDSSSALNIAQKPRTGSHSSTAVVSAPLSISRRYGTNKFSSSTMYFAINEPCTAQLFTRHQVSGIRYQASSISFHHLMSATSHRGSPLASALSSQYSQVQLLDSCVTVAQRHDGLRSRRHGSVCALPLDWETRHRPRKVIKVRTKTSNPSHPPHPTHHAPPPREPSHTLSGASQDGPSPAGRLRACLPVLNAIRHARNREQPSDPKQLPCPERRETEKESLFHVKQRTKPGTK